MPDTATGIYPMTKMSFVVDFKDITGTDVAKFSEITGIEGSVDVIEFRYGNMGNLNMLKIPGLVHNGNVTMRFGYSDVSLIKWFEECVSPTRKGFTRRDVSIQLLDNGTDSYQANQQFSSAGKAWWILKNAWVVKYSIPDMDAKSSDVAIASVEIAYEELQTPYAGAAQ